MSDNIQVVMVSRKSSSPSKQQPKSQIETQLQELKVTNNLINQINFNSTVNRFEYLEELLSKEHTAFHKKINKIVNQQVIRQMKNVQKQVRQIKLPTLNYNRIMAQSQELIRVKRQSDKNSKLSQGMLIALGKMEKQVDNLLEKKGLTEMSERVL